MTKRARRVLWYPTQARVRLEWGTQPSLPVKRAVHSSLNLPQASQLLGLPANLDGSDSEHIPIAGKAVGVRLENLRFTMQNRRIWKQIET
jgi:hypothetical protein